MSPRFFLSLLVFVLSTLPLSAETREHGARVQAFEAALIRCSQMPAGMVRDECVDHAAEAHGPGNHWLLHTAKSQIDDSQTVVLSRGAFNVALEFTRRAFKGMFIDKSASSGPPEMHTIVMMCREGTTSFSINFRDYRVFTSDGGDKVTYRIDDRPAVTHRFQVSHTNDSLSLGKGTVPFIKSLLGAKKLTVRISPYGQHDITNEFRLDGLDEKIVGLRRACRW